MSANALKIRNSLLLTPLSLAPSSPSNGEIYYDSVSNLFKFYQNGSFLSYTSGGITALTGDIVATGPGSVSATIQAGVVSASKLGSVTDGITLDQSGAGSTLEVKAGGISNSHINTSAAIAYSKLALSNSIVNADINASAAIAYSKLNLATSIVNTDIASGAAIAYSKLALSNSIVNADINTSAAIAYSKLNLTTSIVNADVASGAAIAYSKLNLTTSIVNADINAAAAIAYSKLNLATSIVNADINAAAAIAYSKLALSNSIVNADINAAAAIVYSKLNLTGNIINTDINASAAIAYSKLNLTTSIVNADINAAAAIVYSKLNLATSIVNADLVNNTITNAKLAQMAAHTYKGNNTGSTANAADITSTQLTADLNQFTSSLQGLVPGSGGGTANFLRADGTWAAPTGSSGVTTVGTIDSQTASADGLVISGSSIYAQSASSTKPGLVNNTTQSFSGVKTFTSAPNLSSLTASLPLVLDGSRNITSASILLASQVSGVLPIANGGTNNGSLSVTAGSVYYGDGTKLVALAPGTTGQLLQSNASSAPTWVTSTATVTVAARYTGATASISDTASLLTYTTSSYDTNSAYSSGVYTIPTTGKYAVYARLLISGTFTTDFTSRLMIYVNGVEVSQSLVLAGGANSLMSNSVSDTLDLTSGDLVKIFVRSNATSPAVSGSADFNVFTISRVGTGNSVTTVGAIDTQTASADGLVISNASIYAQSASSTKPGLVNNTTQSFSGNKTFTGSISASNLSGTNTGDQTITLTGDVTGTGTGSFAATIAANAVTNAKLAQISTATFKGRTTAGTGNVEDLTATQATALLNNFVGDSGSGGTKGLVPAPASGDAAASKFLKADGTWTVVSGGGSSGGIGGSGFVNVATTYNATSTDNNKVLLLDTSTSYTVTLPSHVSGQIITLKDKTGNASTNNITIARNGGTGKIEGLSSSYTMQADFSAMTFFDDGTDWWRIL